MPSLSELVEQKLKEKQEKEVKEVIKPAIKPYIPIRHEKVLTETEIKSYIDKQIREQIGKEQKTEMVREEKPIINEILLNFARYDFDTWTNDLMIKYDLKKFDKTYKFFFDMKNIKNTPEIMNDPEKLKWARVVNRLKRGDSAMYKTMFNDMRERILKAIKKEG